MEGPGGNTRVVRRRKTGTGEGLGHSLYWDFPGWTRQGGVNVIRLANLNHFGGLSARRLVSSCLVPAERGGLALDWLVCMSRAGSWVGPSLPLRIG